MAPFTKPEAVLKQAEGLISVGQNHAALQSLTEMFGSKRFRSTPLASLEPVMLRFVELCVDMRKGRTAKEGLMQYKNIAQNTSVGSIEVVIKKFVQLADAKVQEAQEKADRVVALEDVDDLEASETPEGILLGAVSGDQSRDRTDRALVTPWLKFLWESYRTALETLKNNARLEAIYQQIAHQAFKFCLKHNRKVEFRRLCETLRLHLANVAKYAHQPHAINLSDPDILQHHLDTRFAQLNTSVELELWQEAFRSVEDVHNLLTMAKKAPRPAMMANYYEKLAKIFLMSGSSLFHAAAWSRYYAIVRSSGGKSDEDISRLAGLVLLSGLAVPVAPEAEEGAEEGKGRHGRLTALLGLSKMPSRVGLLQEALSRNLLKLAPPMVRNLYEILEVTFDPLGLCSSISPILKSLAADSSYAPYLPSLNLVILSRLFSQLGQVYSSIKITHVLDLISPLNDGIPEGQSGRHEEERVEAFIMACARRGELLLRVDHAQGSITFVDDVFSAPSRITATSTIQESPGTLIQTRLSRVAQTLHTSLAVLFPKPEPESSSDKLQALIKAAEAERKALHIRRALVARRRELLSELAVRKEKEEASRKAEQARRDKEEESKRAMEEMRRKELEKAKRDIDNIRTEEARKIAQGLKSRGKLAVDIDEIDGLDTTKLVQLQVEQMDKEKRELNERLRIVSKRVDHLERALRKEERPLLALDYEQQLEDDRKAHEQMEKMAIETARDTHQSDLDTKRRLARIQPDYQAMLKTMIAKKEKEFTAKKESAQKKINSEKAKRKEAVLKQRQEERERKEDEERAERDREEEEERLEQERQEEEDRRRAEEEEAAAALETAKMAEVEKAAAVRAAREKERAEAAETARQQRLREEEAEQRRQQRKLDAAKSPASPFGSAKPVATSSESPSDTVWRRPAGGATSRPLSMSGSGSGTPVSPAPTKFVPPAARARAEGREGPPSRPESPALPPSRYQPPGARGPSTGESMRSPAESLRSPPAPRGSPVIRGGAPSAGGGWREKERLREEAGAAGRGPGGSPNPNGDGTPPTKDDDGFTPVAKSGVWKSSRIHGGQGGR